MLFPALRLGFLVLPQALVPAFTRAKWLAGRHAPSLEQTALAEFLKSGEFEQHLRRTRTRNARRRAALLEALERYLGDRFEVSGSNAGIHVLVWLSGFDERALSELTQRAAEDGVGLYSAAPYYATPKKARAGLLFGYGSLDVGQIEEGVRRFASYVS